MSSFYRPRDSGSVQVSVPSSCGVRVGERGSRGVTVARRDIPEPSLPAFRAVGPTQNRPGKVGLTNSISLEIEPYGCLFRLEHSWFDLHGYWCRRRNDGTVDVRRGAPRDVNKRLSKEQKKMLERARLQARRKGVR